MHTESTLLISKSILGFAAAAISAGLTHLAEAKANILPALWEYGAWGLFSGALIYAVMNLWRANAKLQSELREDRKEQIEALEKRLDASILRNNDLFDEANKRADSKERGDGVS